MFPRLRKIGRRQCQQISIACQNSHPQSCQRMAR
jgi:hypothetical protein